MQAQAPDPVTVEPDQAALDSFVAKWRERWPEWKVVEVFVPKGERAIATAWAALLQELTDAAWGGQDPRPGLAKLAWWAEELNGWLDGRRRHPLGATLQRLAAPWGDLAAALPALQESRDRPRDSGEAYEVLAPFAAAVVAVEASLFDGGAPVPAEAERDAVTAALLQARFFQHGDGHVPLAVFARAGEGDPRTIWAQQLRQRWPVARPSRPVRRLWCALARSRLWSGADIVPLAPLRALAVGWRAARN